MSKFGEIVFKLYHFSFDGEIKELDSCEGVYVKYDGRNAEVGGRTVPQLMRAYTLFVKNMKVGKTKFEIFEKPAFDTCGVMIDASRNAVMRVEKVKEFINYMASLGMNYLMLYTEDTYEIPEYPLMGYMRGRYSVSELKEIDDYAFSLGVEVVPCIQTLAHMNQFLQWSEYSNIKDTANVLLAGETKTYDFIEAAIKSVRSAFRTDKIHIGFDEAAGLGTGQYFHKNGHRESFEILNEHLCQVVKICEKFDFKPIIWGDMYLKIRSKTGNYRDTAFSSADELKKQIPDVEIVYWDYYSTDESVYERLFNEHIVLGKPVSFAGGIWSWCGHLTSPAYTMDTSIPALKTAIKLGIKSVTATMWENDGNECDHFQCIPLLPVFSEFCYKGAECSEKDIKEMAEVVAGCSWEVINAASNFTEFIPDTRKRNYTGKNLVYANLFMHLLNTDRPLSEVKKELLISYEIYENDTSYRFSAFAAQLFKVALAKLEIIDSLRANYKDREYTMDLIENKLPALKNDVEVLAQMHMKQWLNTYKPFGYEVLNGRYGWVMADIDYTIYRLREFAEGRSSCIDELEIVPTSGKRIHTNSFKASVTTSLVN